MSDNVRIDIIVKAASVDRDRIDSCPPILYLMTLKRGNVMDKNKIQKIMQPIIHLPGVNSMGVIGDPGCEGLGTYNMKVYAATLEKSAEDDITLIAGDLVPIGNAHYYEEI